MKACVDCEEPIYSHEPLIACCQCGGVMHSECAMLDTDGDPYCEVHYTKHLEIMEITDAELNRLVKNEPAADPLDHKETCTCQECLKIDAQLDAAFNG
jgi:hypothetical protein